MGFFESLENSIKKAVIGNGRIDRAKAQSLGGNVVIPGCMDEIPDRLFEGNSKITSVTIPGNVKRIGVRAFAECENLVSVTLCEGIESIGSNAFTDCKKLRRVTYPDSVKDYAGSTFYATKLDAPVMNVSGTILIHCPDSVSGQERSVPDTVKVISKAAFFENEAMEFIHLPEGLERIEENAFIGCGLRELTVPFSVAEIEEEAFWRCGKLEKITILNPETKLAPHAFSGCRAVREINYADLYESDRIFHLKGQPFLTDHIGEAADSDHSSDPEFIRLTALCAEGDGGAMFALSEWFDNRSRRKGASDFYFRAANYWRYRAYQKGDPKASRWFATFFKEHPGEQLESILCEDNYHDSWFYSFSVPGKLMNDLGYGFFDPEKSYEIKRHEDEGVVEVGAFESYEGPDEDGFGAENYYDWWFLDENFQEIPGVRKVNSSSANDKEVMDERAMAVRMVRQRKAYEK